MIRAVLIAAFAFLAFGLPVVKAVANVAHDTVIYGETE
jgi:hypothetical protein